jgi:hypothetical protein
MLIIVVFTLKTEGFTLEHGDASTNKPHAIFFTQCTTLHKYLHRVVRRLNINFISRLELDLNLHIQISLHFHFQ